MSQLDGLFQLGAYQPLGLVHLFWCDGQLLQPDVVETLLIVEHGLVASLSHVVEHTAHRLLQLRVV